MLRRFCVSLLAFASLAGGCESRQGAAPASSQGAAGARSEAAVPKATDPESLKTLTLDGGASKFNIEMAKVTKTHQGSFAQFSGMATIIGDELQSIVVEVETASLRADDPDLGAHIKTADFLDVEKFPKATFKSSSITRKPAGGATHEVSGALTLHGVTQPVTFPATVAITEAALQASADVRIDRQKFGVTYPGMPDDLIKDEVVLKPALVFAKK